MVTVNISQSNVLENITSEIIKKMYDVAIDPNNTVTFAGNLYSPSGYAAQVEYLRNAFSPDLTITVPLNGLFISFEDSAVESVIKTFLGISNDSGITVGDAANATFTSNTFKNNTTITSFNEFSYFTKANTNPPIDLFRGCTNLAEIDLTSTDTISNNEFYGSSIAEVNAPSLRLLGSSSFAYCTSLTTITNLGNITSIPVRAFLESYNILSVTLPSSVTSIENFAFYANFANPNTSLTYIDLSNITYIGSMAFTNQLVLSIDMTNLSNFTYIGEGVFNACFNIYGELNLPKLTSIGNNAFLDCHKITKIKCLGKVSSIPTGFKLERSSNLLSEVYIPYECTSIGQSAFSGNSSLTTIKQYTLSVDDWVEGETPTYTDISRVATFGPNCFQNCSSLQIPASALVNAINIGQDAFYSSGLTGILNCPNLVSIGNNAFRLTNITSVLNLGLVSEIGDPFWNCPSITEIILPTTLRKSGCFFNTHVSKLIYPYGYTELIASSMCGGLLGRYLLYILFPSTVTKIVCDDMYRDAGSSRIRCHIVVLATTPPNTNRNPSDTGGMGLGWSWGDPSQANWYVPDAVVNTYKADAQWSSIANYIFPISQLETDSPTCWAWYQANKDYGVPTQS